VKRAPLGLAWLLLSGCAGGPAASHSLVTDRDTVTPGAREHLAVPFTEAQLADILMHSPLPPPPPDPTNAVADDPDAARLGHVLFFDERLSGRSRLSCASCHDPGQGFSDGRALSEGVEVLTRHSPSLWNVAYQRWFFWDGRRDTLWSQALVPLEDPLEHAFTRTGVARAVHDTPRLRTRYEEVFGPLPPLDDVARFVDELRRREVALPAIFGVFYYRSANPKTLERLAPFLRVPAEGLARDCADGVTADEICARTIAALRGIGYDKTIVAEMMPYHDGLLEQVNRDMDRILAL